MTMKHGLLPEDRPQDHGAVREASTVASLLDVLGDATRLAILRHLHGGEHRVVELTEHLGLAQSTVSQHLAILRSAGLISSHSHGRANVSRIENPEAIEQVLAAAESLAAVISADGASRGQGAAVSIPAGHEPAPHSHHHSHGHSHNHGAGASRGRLLVALCLSATVLVAEIVTALVTGSLALLADAGHMLTDVAGLAMALTAAQLSTRPATDRSTWGMRRAEVIGAALQAGMLAAVGLFVAFKAVHNLLVAPQVEASGMLVMGVIGLAANVIALLVLSGGRGHDGHGENLNMRAALLEVLNDALGSVGVIIAAAVVARTGWTRADAVASLLIAVLILPRAVTLLRSALAVLMDFTPRELDLAQVRSHMLGIDHVEEVHDLHAWTVASGMPVLTAHVVVRDECLRDGHTEEILDRLQNCVAEHFPVRIQHATLQLEPVSHLEHEAAYC